MSLNLSKDPLTALFSEVGDQLSSAPDVERAFDCLRRVGDAFGLPYMVALPDMFDFDHPDTEILASHSTLPKDIFEEVRDRGYTLNNDPVLWDMRLPIVLPTTYRKGLHDGGVADPQRKRDMKVIESELHKIGVECTLLLPVHQPMGRMGLISLGGAMETATVAKNASENSGNLLAFGHLFFARIAKLQKSKSPSFDFPILSRRELGCLRMIANGYHMPEVAKVFDISTATVRYYLDNCRTKLQARTLSHAVGLCAQYGLLGQLSTESSASDAES